MTGHAQSKSPQIDQIFSFALQIDHNFRLLLLLDGFKNGFIQGDG